MELEGASSGEWEWADNTQELYDAAQAVGGQRTTSGGTSDHTG